MENFKILYIGPERFARIFAEEIGYRGATTFPLDLNCWKKMNLFRRMHIMSTFGLVHYYWGRRISIGEILFARLSGIKIIYTFIGSDVIRIAEAKRWKRVRAKLGMKMVHQVTVVAPWLKEELKTLGIDSKVLPAVIVKPQERIWPLPEKFTVLSYVPPDRPGFYGWETILRLARDMPDINFEIVGHDGKNLEQADNIRFNGWVNPVIPYIQKSNVLLRLTEHDGLSRIVIETLSCERHVIWTYTFPFCKSMRATRVRNEKFWNLRKLLPRIMGVRSI